MSDYLDKMAAYDRKLAVEEPGEHFLDLPHCPKCGEPEHEWWDGHGLKNDGDTTEFYCGLGGCDATYDVTMCVSTSFKTTLKVKP